MRDIMAIEYKGRKGVMVFPGPASGIRAKFPVFNHLPTFREASRFSSEFPKNLQGMAEAICPVWDQVFNIQPVM